MGKMNLQRAGWAHEALQVFSRETGQSLTDEDKGQTVLKDLLSDLMHWATFRGIDFDATLYDARDNYQGEFDDDE